MKSSVHEMTQIQEGKTPNRGRNLLELKGKQSYEYQLDLDIPGLIQSLLDKKDTNILDICINHSEAISQLKSQVLSGQDNGDINIQLSGIDLQEIESSNNEIDIFQGDLEDPDFLKKMELDLGNQSQNVIFMNQGTQYLSDRLGVLQFILENLLAEGGEFHFNLIDDYFMVGKKSYPWQFVTELEKRWKQCDGFTFTKTSVPYDNGPNSSVYHFKKEKKDAKIAMPYFKMSQTNNFGYVNSSYSFIDPIE